MINENQKLKTPTKWDKRIFSLTELVASWSEDRSRSVGAVIVGPNYEIVSTGYNGLPRGVNSQIESRHSKVEGEKYFWFEHAERNAIYNAARIGTPLSNTIIYSSLFPCSSCIRGIVQSGIKKLRTFPPPKNDIQFQRSFEVAIEIANEAGLSIELF